MRYVSETGTAVSAERLADLLRTARELIRDKHTEYADAAQKHYADTDFCTGQAAQQLFALAADSMAGRLEVIAHLQAVLDDDRDGTDDTVLIRLPRW